MFRRVGLNIACLSQGEDTDCHAFELHVITDGIVLCQRHSPSLVVNQAKEVREASQPLQDAPPTTPATDTGNDPSVALGTGIRVPTNIDVLVCELCKGGYHEDQIILCDSCDRGFHLFCLSPPMEAIPDGDWVCPLCLKAESDNYAFKPGYELSWAEFERHANAFRRNFWGGEAKARKVRCWQCRMVHC